MTALLIGADRLGNIPDELERVGFENLIHWSGRKKQCRVKTIPQNVDVVLMFSDYLNHCLMYEMKKQAKARKIPMLFCKRSLACVQEALKNNSIVKNMFEYNKNNDCCFSCLKACCLRKG